MFYMYFGGIYGCLSVRVEAVADPRLGQDMAGFGRVGLDLLTEVADEDPQVLGLCDVVSAPDCGEQRAMREDFTGVSEEVNQKIEFLRRQMQLLPAHGDVAFNQPP
jgi:hypothetical protein